MSADAPVKFATDREQIERLRKLGRILRDNGSFMTTPVGSFGGNELLMISAAAESFLSHPALTAARLDPHPAALERARAEGAAEMRDFVQRLTHDLRSDMLAKMAGAETAEERLRWRTYEEAYAAYYVTIGEKTIQSFDVVERARADERERCAKIVADRIMAARLGDLDADLRSIAGSIDHDIRALGPRPSQEAGAPETVASLLRRVMAQVESDLASAHAEICKLQGLDPAAHEWPAWSPQANTLRWFDQLRREHPALATPPAMTPDLRPISEWHEEIGPVLWWRAGEAPYVGSPLDTGQPIAVEVLGVDGGAEIRHNHMVGGWPGDDYFAGWTPLPDTPRAFLSPPSDLAGERP